jgi:hydrogenase-4 component B
MLVAALAGIGGAVAVLVTGRTELYVISWTLPFDTCEFGVDPLSAWFLLPVFLIPGCSALYSRGYWPAQNNPGTVRKLTVFLGILTAAMSMVVMARNSIIFLVAWEIMALACYFILTTEDDKPEVRDAGTLYLITTHAGTLALFVLFSLLRSVHGSFLFPAAGSLPAAPLIATAIFACASIGFGMKAGIMPLHIWLPSAHANAPSHISAIMSGVVLKIGIYGLIRTLSFFAGIPSWWGVVVLALGAISGVVGVAFAIGQHDLKRLLAYHSIENIGIITMGIGVALIGEAIGNSAMVVLGMGGALLHVLNHATFKALLFLGAGSVIHAAGTREIDLMGGLSRRMPYTALLFGIGAVAICGLPPLNGFVSELFIYLGFFTAIQAQGGAAAFSALATPALALIGGLAIACFVKVSGVVFLGNPRSAEAREGHEAPMTMLAPMVALAFVCVVIGIVPAVVTGGLEEAVRAVFPDFSSGASLQSLAPLGWVTILNMTLLALIGVIAAAYYYRLRKTAVSTAPTWGCGYLNPNPRMQYSASSFAQMLTSLFAFVLKTDTRRPVITGIFPTPATFHSHVPEAVLELVYIPALERLYKRFLPIRKLQSGVLQQYVLYILLTLVALFLSDYISI